MLVPSEATWCHAAGSVCYRTLFEKLMEHAIMVYVCSGGTSGWSFLLSSKSQLRLKNSKTWIWSPGQASSGPLHGPLLVSMAQRVIQQLSSVMYTDSVVESRRQKYVRYPQRGWSVHTVIYVRTGYSRRVSTLQVRK